MKKIVTLFGCLPFTNISVSILPITSRNFYLFFIAFIVTFFLLGIIIGYMLNPRRSSRKTKDGPSIEASKAEQGAPKVPGQDIPSNEVDQQRRIDNRNPRNESNNNNYNNYWDYSQPRRRY